MADEKKNQKSQDTPPPEGMPRRPYEKPAWIEETVFEKTALACNKQVPASPTCTIDKS